MMTDTTKKTISEVLIGMAVYLAVASVFVLILPKTSLRERADFFLADLRECSCCFQ